MKFIHRFETLASIQSWTYQRMCDELIDRCKDEARRILTDTVVMGYEPDAVALQIVLIRGEFSVTIEPMALGCAVAVSQDTHSSLFYYRSSSMFDLLLHCKFDYFRIICSCEEHERKSALYLMEHLASIAL